MMHVLRMIGAKAEETHGLRANFVLFIGKTPIKTFWAKGAQKNCVHMHCDRCVVFTPPVAHVEIAISDTDTDNDNDNDNDTFE